MPFPPFSLSKTFRGKIPFRFCIGARFLDNNFDIFSWTSPLFERVAAFSYFILRFITVVKDNVVLSKLRILFIVI